METLEDDEEDPPPPRLSEGDAFMTSSEDDVIEEGEELQVCSAVEDTVTTNNVTLCRKPLRECNATLC